jgi:membrane-bound lytic murein transglycosylase D
MTIKNIQLCIRHCPRLWKLVGLTTCALLFSACAHQQTQDSNSTSAAAHVSSVSWPLLPLNELPAASDAKVKEVDKVPVNLAAQPASVEKPVENSSPPAKLAKTLATPPPAIKFPKPKNAEAAMDTPLIFDIPVAYNSRVKYWIEYFQTNGRPWYTKWLERSSRYLPVLQKTLKKNGLPQDLAYIAMIESGFSSQASSAAKAVGPWQFIRETGTRYGLKVTWWLDERRDFQKSTEAAAKYLKKMYGMFHNWYLVAAGYNTGEHRIKRVIEKQGTKNFWKIAQKNDLESETRDYVPKLIAALLIAKSPQMYGFNKINYNQPLSFETIRAPGGTRLDDIADAIGVTATHMRELNPELVRGYVPSYVETHPIRIPKGSYQLVSRFFRHSMVSER